MARALKKDHGPDSDLQRLILKLLEGRNRSTVVSINILVTNIREALPECRLSNRQLAKRVFEACMQLGLIPVYDPEIEGGPEGDFRGAYGYGHHAHKGDPLAQYGFEPSATRPLPVRPGSRWR